MTLLGGLEMLGYVFFATIGITMIFAIPIGMILLIEAIHDYYYNVPREYEKKINFYHPLIKKTYYELSNYEKKTNDIKKVLLKQNAHMLEFYPYNNMEDRLKQIDKNYALQTVFNYIKYNLVNRELINKFNQS